MSFAKYVSLLETSSLWFARGDQFDDDDPFEGSTPYIELERRRIHSESVDNPAMQMRFFEHEAYMNSQGRQWKFLSCWHMNEGESAAMWRLYSRGNEAIAVQSTYARLRDCHTGRYLYW